MALPRLVPRSAIDPSSTRGLRTEVRQFLAEQLAAGTFTPSVDAWLSGWDEDFTAALAERGWLGMTVPVAYGGQGRSFLERFVVTEELLAAGAPVAAHWIADRQIGPSLLQVRHRGAEVRRSCRGSAAARCFFGIGMSEPDSGSDLASVRTRAEPRRRRAGSSPAPRSGPPAPTRPTRSSRWPAPRRSTRRTGTTA